MTGLWPLPFFLTFLLTGYQYLSNKVTYEVTHDFTKYKRTSSNIYDYLGELHPWKFWIEAHDENDDIKVQAMIDNAVLNDELSPRVYYSQQSSLVLTGAILGLIFLFLGWEIVGLVFWFLGTGATTDGVVLIFQLFFGVSFLWLPLLLSYQIRQKVKRQRKRVRKEIPLSQLNLFFAKRNGSTTETILYSLGTDKGSLFAPHFRRAYLKGLSDKKAAFDYLHDVFDDTEYAHSIQLLEHSWKYREVDLLRSLDNERYTTNEQLREEIKRERANTRMFSNLMSFLPVVSAVGFIIIIALELFGQISDVVF